MHREVNLGPGQCGKSVVLQTGEGVRFGLCRSKSGRIAGAARKTGMNQSSLKLSQVSNIMNIMLGVRDLALSLAFYRDTLGLSVQQQIPGFAFLGGGGVTLALSEPLAKALP